MKICLQILLFSLILSSSLLGQFQDDFEDEDFSNNPTWIGDDSNFIVNQENRLQLNAPDAGQSMLYISSDFAKDQSWKFDLNLDFAPSSGNFLEIFLQLDNNDPAQANGYCLRIGEDGSDDALVFYRLDMGTLTEIARGESGSLASAPAKVQLSIDRIDGLWAVSTDYQVSDVLVEELLFNDDTYGDVSDGFFLLHCQYTSTRKDKFSFDNFSVGPYTPDTTGPEIVAFERIDDQNFIFNFNELIDPASLPDIMLTFNPSNSVESVEMVNTPGNSIFVKLSDPLVSGPEYSVNISGISDLKGNPMTEQTFNFVVSVSAMPFDVVINEVLFDPYTSENDFIELYNRSDKIINLENHQLVNVTKEDRKVIEDEIILYPQDYIAFTLSDVQLISIYSPPADAVIVNQSIPSLNNESGNISLYNPQEIMIDSFDYLEDWHYQLLDDTEGVSLERIFIESETNNKNNWFSASSTFNYATPGYKNSNAENAQQINSDFLSVNTSHFSPNGDGDADILFVSLKTQNAGYTGTIEIFNVQGYKIKTLLNNQLLGGENQIIWDGLDDQGLEMPIGQYIILATAFHTNGDILKGKTVVKLLDYLK